MNARGGSKIDTQARKAFGNRWDRLIDHVKRELAEREARRTGETSSDRAARRTATATVWLAVFTVVLAIVSIGTLLILRNQLKEMHEGGIDTHSLAAAAADQAAAARSFATSATNMNLAVQDAVNKLNLQAKETQALVITAQDIYKTANRPYVGPNGGSITFFRESNTGENVPEPHFTKGVTSMAFTLNIKNFGSAPGNNFEVKLTAAIDGSELPRDTLQPRPAPIFPGEVRIISGQLGEPSINLIYNKGAVFQMDLQLHYDGPSKSYSFCNRQQYDRRTNSFLDLGPVCGTPWGTR